MRLILKTWIMGLVIFKLMNPSVALADEVWFTPFSWYDYALEATYFGVTSMDWSQTQQIANDPAHYHEMNPLLGQHPSLANVNVLIPSAMALHALIAYALPKPFREVWQMAWIGVEASTVQHNASIGLRIKF